MIIREPLVSFDEARKIDMVDYLSTLGYQPSKISKVDYWYLSPLREEKTASFKINRRLNCWYDHGIGKGGGIIDFAILYYNCTIKELLQQLTKYFSFPATSYHNSTPFDPDIESKICIIKEPSIASLALERYLDLRRIPLSVAQEFCSEISYRINNKEYYAIGFKNNSGGFELRNAFSKLSIAPKDITTLNNGANTVAVFEGFFDFLSFIAIQKNQPSIHSDYVVLNSLSFFEKARPFMESHAVIHLYLDNDTAGQNCTSYALSLSSRYKDERSLYGHYKDFNDWTINIGKADRKFD
jgi:hypothetical protein